MNINLSNKKIEHIKTPFEIVILKTTNHLEKSQKEILDNIFFTKKSFNISFNSLTNKYKSYAQTTAQNTNNDLIIINLSTNLHPPNRQPPNRQLAY